MWRDWFTFSRQDRRAILLLSVLIVIAMSLLWTKPLWRSDDVYDAYVLDSMLLSSDIIPGESDIVKVTLHAFDPNVADSLELLSLGLSPYVTRNILRYRKAGGVFRRPDDLARIYGLHDTVFARVKPYIAIPAEASQKKERTTLQTAVNEPVLIPIDTARREHPYAEYMKAKLKPGEFVDLNTADTATLVKIPGIGPVYARMIVDYRRRLGGFHHVGQLRELEGLPENLGDWVHVSTPHTESLHINKLSVTQLRSHPYLTFYQAKAIADLRKREGNIASERQLLFLDEFTEADIERLRPYLSFE